MSQAVHDARNALRVAVQSGDTLECKILIAIAKEPELMGARPARIAAKLGLDRGEVCALFRDPEFHHSIQQVYAEALGGAAEILAAVRKKMQLPGREGFAYLKLACQLSGMLDAPAKSRSAAKW
jgi:hypothetical protein